MSTNQTIGGSGIAGGTWTIQSTNTATVGRYHDLAFLAEGAVSTNEFTQARPGCLPGPADSNSAVPSCFAQLPTGSGLNLQVRRGAAVVERTTLAGPYIVETNATGTVTFTTADPTNPRKDRVDLQVFDGALGDNGGVSLTQFAVTTGVASGAPSLPAAPSNSVPICTTLLPANTATLTAGMVTDTRRSAGLRGAVRMMLPGDSLSDAGYMAGELRDTTAVQAAAGAPGTIDRWDPTANSGSGGWTRIVDLSAATAQYFTDTNAITSVTVTSYTAMTDSASANVGVSFVAPASGKVRLDWGANARSDTDNVTVFIGVEVRQGSSIGSGTVVSSCQDSDTCQTDVVGNNAAVSRMRTVTGLTPGASYNARLLWRMQTASHTGSCANPWVSAEPKAA